MSLTYEIDHLLKRIANISTPVFGTDWEPNPDERDVASSLMLFLEEHRILFEFRPMGYWTVARESITYDEIKKSIQLIRKKVATYLNEVDPNSKLYETLSKIRDTCATFLNNAPDQLKVLKTLLKLEKKGKTEKAEEFKKKQHDIEQIESDAFNREILNFRVTFLILMGKLLLAYDITLQNRYNDYMCALEYLALIGKI